MWDLNHFFSLDLNVGSRSNFVDRLTTMEREKGRREGRMEGERGERERKEGRKGRESFFGWVDIH